MDASTPPTGPDRADYVPMPRRRRTPVAVVTEALPRLTLDELADVCGHLVSKHPRQAVALSALLEEAGQSGRGQKVRDE